MNPSWYVHAVNRILLGVAVAAMLVVASLWWWTTTTHGEPAAGAGRTAAPSLAPLRPVVVSAPPRADARLLGDARPATLVRHIAAEERHRIEAQLAASHGHDAAKPALAASEMATPAQVLAQLQALHHELNSSIRECAKLAPKLASFKTEITLVGDADIGTLVDAADPVLGDDGVAVPRAFSDCIRGELQTLELPAMQTGDAYKASFEVQLQ